MDGDEEGGWGLIKMERGAGWRREESKKKNKKRGVNLDDGFIMNLVQKDCMKSSFFFFFKSISSNSTFSDYSCPNT